MNAYTRISDKGQVVVPQATCDRLGWTSGTDLEVIENGDAVTLRRRRTRETLTIDQAIERWRSIYRHEGPPVPVEQLGWSAEFDRPDR